MNNDIDLNNLRRSTSPGMDCKPQHRIAGNDTLRLRISGALDRIKFLSRAVRIFQFDLALVEGIEKHSGSLVKTLYVGETKPPVLRPGRLYSRNEAVEKYANFIDIMDSVYSDYSIVMKKKNINGFNIRRKLKIYEEKADLVFIDMELLSVRGLDRSRYLPVPQWVTLKVELADRWDDCVSSFPKSLQKEIKRLLRREYSYCNGNTMEQFNYFYHEMYVPYTRRRFGNAAVIYPKERLKLILQDSQILFLFRDNRLLLGNFNIYKNDSLFSLCSAAADNLQPEMFRGAAEVIDYFSMICAFEKGCRVFDFMGSRPMLADGAFRYKRKWGARVDKFYRAETNIYFKVLNMSDGVKRYLAGNPFIVETSKGLRGRVLLNKPVSSKEIGECVKYHYTKGMTGLDIFCTGVIQGETDQIGKKYLPGVIVHDISHSKNPEQDFCML